jgi:N6-adenosine-specific RNA methylase IME4
MELHASEHGKLQNKVDEPGTADTIRVCIKTSRDEGSQVSQILAWNWSMAHTNRTRCVVGCSVDLRCVSRYTPDTKGHSRSQKKRPSYSRASEKILVSPTKPEDRKPKAQYATKRKATQPD